jgi:hypothetical protein
MMAAVKITSTARIKPTFHSTFLFKISSGPDRSAA